VIFEALVTTWQYEWIECTNLEEAQEKIAVLAFAKIKEVGGVYYTNTGASIGPLVWNHTSKTRENLIRTIVWYVDQYENEGIEVVKLADGRPAVEYSFSLPVDNGIVFSGHIDRLVQYHDETYCMDQKTTGSTISANYFKQFSPDTQFSMYTFAGQMIYQSNVKGVIIDAAQVMVGFSRFERGFTFRTPSQLEEWYEGSMHHIEEARKATLEQNFPMRTTSCGNFGGCEFRDVCARDARVRENFLRADFVKGERWDPLKRR
jgi:hypothetical protein